MKYSLLFIFFVTLFAGMVHGTEAPKASLDQGAVTRILAVKEPLYPKRLVQGLYLQGGYATPHEVDIHGGLILPLSHVWPVSIGYDFLHMQIAKENFQKVSDEMLVVLAAGLIAGGITTAFGDPTSTETESSTLGTVLTIVATIPVFAYCGSLYVPVVPGAWLGVIDKNHWATQLISEGFHKRSFTYHNDLGLRLSPFAADKVHLFADGGIRFEKNLDAPWERRYFAQLGVALSL